MSTFLFKATHDSNNVFVSAGVVSEHGETSPSLGFQHIAPDLAAQTIAVVVDRALDALQRGEEVVVEYPNGERKVFAAALQAPEVQS